MSRFRKSRLWGKNEKGLALTPSPTSYSAFGYLQNTAIGRYSARASERTLARRPSHMARVNPLGAATVPEKTESRQRAGDSPCSRAGPRRRVVGMGSAMRQQRLASLVFGPLHGDQTLI
jgi:hypothetical protein